MKLEIPNPKLQGSSKYRAPSLLRVASSKFAVNSSKFERRTKDIRLRLAAAGVRRGTEDNRTTGLSRKRKAEGEKETLRGANAERRTLNGRGQSDKAQSGDYWTIEDLKAKTLTADKSLRR